MSKTSNETPYYIDGEGCPDCNSNNAIKCLDDSFACSSCGEEIPESRIEKR